MGPFYIMLIELLSTLMAVSQVYVMLVIGFKGYDQVKQNFMFIFENVL
jgi:hypothetical protein